MSDGDLLVLGIDLGVSGARAAVMDQRGRVVATSALFPVETRAAFGRAEQDPEAWLGAVADSIRDALRPLDAPRIAAIGVSALGPAPVLVSEDLAPLAPALLFSLDTRAEDERRSLVHSLGLADAGLTHDHAIPKLLWWRDHEPARWKRARMAMDATGFIVSHLTGVPTMDAITACDYVLEGYATPLPVPGPTDPLTVAGPLRASWAERTGLPTAVPVLTGTYDSHADTAATGTLAYGDAAILFGTTLIVSFVCRTVAAQLHGLVASPHLGEGFLVGGATATGGSALEWVLNVLGVPASGAGATEFAARRAAPSSDGLLFLPYLCGERSPVSDPRARGVLLGLSVDTKQHDIYRAVIDGLALSVRDHAERLALIGDTPSAWRAGGGGTRNPAWVQATSDALAAPLEIVAGAGAAIGPCRLALRGIGLDPPIEIAGVVEPNAENHERFDVLYRVYRTLYPALAQDMHLLTELNQTTEVKRADNARCSNT
jgi:xylulokinase